MIVISDTSPLRYLALIGQVNLPHRLYGTIHCPAAVCVEASHQNAPFLLRAFIQEPPAWLVLLPSPPITDTELDGELDPGEAEAITVAVLYKADLLLIDERDGRRMAEARGLRVAGTLNILADAAVRGWLDYQAIVEQLRTTNFRVSDEVVEKAYWSALSD